jgi:hypothetical protein
MNGEALKEDGKVERGLGNRRCVKQSAVRPDNRKLAVDGGGVRGESVVVSSPFEPLTIICKSRRIVITITLQVQFGYFVLVLIKIN